MPCLHQLLTTISSGPVQLTDELKRVRSKDLVLTANWLSGDSDAIDSEVVSEAVHFNLSYEKQMFDGGGAAWVPGARVPGWPSGRHCSACYSPYAGLTSLGEDNP